MENLIVIKIGGNTLSQLQPSFFQQLQCWRKQNKKILLLHGGGTKITELSHQLNLPVRKINGIRVTDEQVLEVTRLVLLGRTQPLLLQQLAVNSLPALGLNAADQFLLRGSFLDKQRYGFVGKIVQVNSSLLEHLLAEQIGVLAPLALSTAGQWLNVNGDSAAAAIASLLGAKQLYLMTDVPGVLKAGQVLPTLNRKTAQYLQAAHVITTGMQPKIQAAFHAVDTGVNQVQITDHFYHSGTKITQEGVNNDEFTFSNL
ncbi:acetylglutamate kinase [Liquorilactobacillus satsumensis]|uniref:Acetylglutamate kinase n=1 Tax=Liquorilactobacillus satsumensis DSM 16230 = JCM 12392 TaxID=1423801 RepID=A0A0R1V7L5_9LACO|nr:acetylglutamate kinase [Liquorilactobacillus satsumensis]KRL98997.1 acetylglutamate kinase [Liquorilactobacillus satsumensis DSM 16230 = JCM 12392]MCC7666929.1 acetylglutamate kinase [Liquorilactobacillus satsumensis]MCP9328758.1 acetylglutamate kinase [Liquorilactobacillus satsumensis]MCP9357211.1 acetylglutamate kinase [Liquorilactobacillus satsumensis]MCP9371158.1 acetylglutamate kinase [Liquorilactobacillus satsumensis]